MAPRRHRSISNVQNVQHATPPPQRTFTPAANGQRQLGMLPAVYESNMKVLLRREPTITAIIDQFSHVCLYRYNGEKWEKHGYEGSMFVFEKSTYPTYGFYILNRMGAEDYVRPIYPEDDMEIIGDYLMCRFYIDFTKTRLEMGLPYPIPPDAREAFHAELNKRVPPEYQDKDKDKEKRGRSTTLGLWMFSTDARDPLKEVMMRLHHYVKRGLPYPDEFRYGPGRPPPPNPHVRTASARPPTDRANGIQIAPPDGIIVSQSVPPSTTSANGGGSEIDQLFAKLLPASASAPAPLPSAPTPAKSVHDLFAALGTSQAATYQPPQPQQSPAPPAEQPLTGHSLLHMMFASAAQAGTPTISNTAPEQPLPPHPEEIVIVSPKPTSSQLPHVLTQDVISTLMGLTPDSRASSAAPSSVGSRRSAQHRYEGDNEYSEGDFPSEGEGTKSNSRAPTSRGIPTLAVPQAPSSESEGDDAGKVNGARRIPGDVTPRPPAGGARLPPTSPPHFQQRTGTPGAGANGKNGIGAAPSPGPASASARARTLVPFEANSDLWPYPRAPLDDRSFDQDDVVELDFSDTRALSDPTLFSSRLKEKKEKKDRGKKNRKEREKEREREKAEIEKGWDLPTQTQGQPAYQLSATGPVAEAATIAAKTHVTTSPKQTKKAAVNGQGPVLNGALDGTSAKDAVVAAMAARNPAPYLNNVSRNDFVRELLTLIHNDSGFVDNLWQGYLSRVA
ncbi:hypothetical protein C8Q74DRAFT_1283901 [Fomes fomentarius]|nr:hypothetical protein C8Q74DRAFT_1283901 [Fomes fomentarius]